jgi:alpha-L-glutamate ligase-like protein
VKIRILQQLRELGVMGINQRNADIIAEENSRRDYPLVDNKLLTKMWAQKRGMSVPLLYGVVNTEKDARCWERHIAGREDFVIKPARGSAGKGVLVIQEKRYHGYRKSGGLLMSADDIRYHISNILSGMFSLGGQPDQAMLEYRVTPSDFLLRFDPEGMPDFRVVVFRGVPIMAMMRLPTRQSDGKANLHQGAIGIGVDIVTGQMSGGVWQNRLIDENPFTGKKLIHELVPDWEKLLCLAARCGRESGLGYIGVDIVLDRHYGPMILELNARPGLSIQLANRQGLVHRIEAVKAHASELAHWSAEKCVHFAMDQFQSKDS